MPEEDFEEVDVLLCLLVAQIARHQRAADNGDADWVSMSAVEALCQRLGHLGAAAVERGWHLSASDRGLLAVRHAPSGPQVQLEPVVASAVGIDLERSPGGPLRPLRELTSRLVRGLARLRT